MKQAVSILLLLSIPSLLLASGAETRGPRIRHVTERPPLGVAESIPDPPGSPMTAERIELGRTLFFDTILSRDRTVACASCHRPDHGFASPEPLSTGIGGQKTTHNAPTLFNRALGESFMWDGRFATLEEQVLEPVQNPREMGLPLEDALTRLRKSKSYSEDFDRAFPDGVTRENLARSLAGFLRRIWIGSSPVDHFRHGDVAHLSTEARAGLWIFESKGQCWRCHSGPNFTDESFHNTGVGAVDGTAVPGRAAHTKNPQDRGKFKTPTLRGLSMTAPYMHDGSLATLTDVVEFYRDGGVPNAHLDSRMHPLELSDEDIRHLVAFLESLSVTVNPSESQ